jgi:1,4-alpha-glucan branching enzyme
MEKFGDVPLPDNRCRFAVWAPEAGELSVVICGSEKKVMPMRDVYR